MKLKITSALKEATTEVLAAAEELRRIDAVIQKTRDADAPLREALEGARRRLANYEIAVEIDGATMDSQAVKDWRDASEAIERGTSRLSSLETRRAESVAKLMNLETEFEAARGSFADASRQAIEKELIVPLVEQLRKGYALACALESACNVPPYLEMALAKVELPSVLNASVDVLKFQVRHQERWLGANATDAGALELTATLSIVIDAAEALRRAAADAQRNDGGSVEGHVVFAAG